MTIIRSERDDVAEVTRLSEVPVADTITTPNHQAGAVTPLYPQEHAWTELYRAHKAELVNYIKGQWHKDEDTAQDLAHQAFERFLCLPNPAAVERPRAYLFQLVRNLLVDEHRREKVRQDHRDSVVALETEEAPITPEHVAIQQQTLDQIQATIERLPAKRQRAFVLSRVHNLSYREIADDMGISTEGVKKHIMRALDACHQALRSKVAPTNNQPSDKEGRK